MRMWGVEPALLCRKHLLGEHVEMHMFVGSIRKGNSINGYVSSGLVHVPSIASRHDALASELTRRGMSHRSPLLPFESPDIGGIDVWANLAELCQRCPDCCEVINFRKER